MIPIWLSVAKAFIGATEVPGPASNPMILRWARDIGVPAWYEKDEQAWCAVFVNRILLACQLPMSGGGFTLLRAASFTTWGQSMLGGPVPGAIMVFNRDGGSHVGFYVGENADYYRILGGNQGNAVSETWFAKDQLVAIRWPLPVSMPWVNRILLTEDGTPVLTNEA